MSELTNSIVLEDLPLVLAGPMLRHVSPQTVTVWVALQQACEVHLQVYMTTAEGAAIGSCVATGTRSTIALGQSLHVVAVTAEPNSGELSSDRLYAYDLQFSPLHSTAPPQTLHQAVRSRQFPEVSLSYFPHQQPTFALPPSDLKHLRIVHGSCRKPHGAGYDALPILDCVIEATHHQPTQRPHQLFLTGDQIYGDDVAEPTLWLSSRLGETLLGWQEWLPVYQSSSAQDQAFCTPSELPPGKRADIATHQAGFTAGMSDKHSKVNSHLLGLGEYYAAYLLNWSPVGWAIPIPNGDAVCRDRRAIRQWNQQKRIIQQFTHTLWKVRRALANVAVYTIFDDHDVSDDWNLNQAWCLRVYGQPLGRQVVQNALLAYATFQGWGNTPWQFAAGQAGATMLEAAQDWSASKGTNLEAAATMARYLGMPSLDPQTHLPKFVQTGSMMVLERDRYALTWNYVVQSQCHEVIVLNTRTWRSYPIDDQAIAPPMLIAPDAMKQQIRLPLQNSTTESGPSAPAKVTFVIAPTNVFGLKIIDWIHHWQLQHNKAFSTDAGDAWNVHAPALAMFLTMLFEQRQQVIVLSGDIHYSSVIRVNYKPTDAPQMPSKLVQLTCSPMKNEEPLTRIVHTRLKEWLLPEKPRQWLGWSYPPDMVEMHASSKRDRPPTSPPDWTCDLTWLRRDRLKIPAFGNDLTWLQPPWKIRQQAHGQWWRSLLFWNSRWFQDGQEVVGRNNLGLVSFSSQPSSQGDTIVQDLFWFSTWLPIQIASSHFECDL